MARHRGTRSPSPVGSSHSRSKRSRREHDDYERRRRDDDRGHRHRSRSRSPGVSYHHRSIRTNTEGFSQHRYKDLRDSHRIRDRSRDRRDDHHKSSYREHSRDRRRSRDRTGREHRDRSRDRYHKRESSRERDRRRRDDSADSRRSGRRRDSRDRTSTTKGPEAAPEVYSSKYPPTDKVNYIQPTKLSAAVEEEKKKAERIAKLEAWKQKQAKKTAADKQSKAVDGANGTRNLLDEIDRKNAASPAGSSVHSPSAPLTPASPALYAGKFDPKAIVKKASSSSAHIASKLGTDITLMGATKSSASIASSALSANKTVASGSSLSGMINPIPLSRSQTNLLIASSKPLKARGNLGAFGLSSKVTNEADKAATKKGLAFDEEEDSKLKLEKLPTPPLNNDAMDEDTTLANGDKEDHEDDEDDEDEVDMEGGTEEEAAAAARAAAEKREERLQARMRAQQTDNTNSVVDEVMPDAPQQDTVEEEEEVDPLDAFMTNLEDKPMFGIANIVNQKKQTQEPQAMFGDDEQMETAVGDADDDLDIALASKKKKKEIPSIDHSKFKYEPFEKSFYVEPSDLADMSTEELADLRLELDGIKVRGNNVPKPAINWSQCGLSQQVLDVISDLAYEKPSAIQAQAIPAVMSGRDVIAVAKTGSGKTMAFLLPMFRHIKAQKPLKNMDGPIGIVMAPTRELADQIYKACKPFLKALDLRAVCAAGGLPITGQIAALKTGTHIVVCTPGRMIELLGANNGRVTNLRRTTYVVLDEADRMFDLGFEPQVLKILTNVRPDRQTVLFSATLNVKMDALARRSLTEPVEITVGGRSKVAPEITQVIVLLDEDDKFNKLLELLGNFYADDQDEDARTLIFVERHEAADGLLAKLMKKGYPCDSIHGGKDQSDRSSVISDFKSGALPVMIATSVAARGLDVKQLKLVINYDAPNHLEDYVHRAGRTGRAGNTGTAVTFVTPEQDRYCVYISKALADSGQPVPSEIKDLADGFLEKVKAGKEKASVGGFGGKGLERLDQERDATRTRERRAYKTGDEPEEEEKPVDDKAEELFQKAASAVQSSSAPTTIPGIPNGIDLDGKITVHKTEAPAAGPAAPSKNKLEAVTAAVDRIRARLQGGGNVATGAPIDNRGPDAGAYHATLEINDFPQKARWAVTNRTNVVKILEATATSITTKGNFYGPGKEPAPGEAPKLYILVEGDTEISVTNAMREMMRLLKEGTVAAADSDSRGPGRYSVL